MTKYVLILAPKGDLHAAAVAYRIAELGVDVSPVIFDTATHPLGTYSTCYLNDKGAKSELSIVRPLPDPYGNSAHKKLEEWRHQAQHISIDQVLAVWRRRPRQSVVPEEDYSHIFKAFARENSKRQLEGIFAINDKIRILNNSNAERLANNKIFQLSAARNSGFKIPDTLVTNDPQQALDFANSLNADGHEVIYKPLAPSKGAYQGAQIFSSKSEEHIDALRQSPVIFQKRIKGDELRIATINNQVFASRQMVDAASEWVDIREHDTRAEAIDIDDKWKRLLANLNYSMHLEFSSSDFILTESGELVFLDLNPSGQWLWLEEDAKHPISQAIAEHLTFGAIKLELNLCVLPSAENLLEWVKVHSVAGKIPC
ncbi:MAG: hypothetical protein AAF936_12730 [Pseudomonadota bacterium]